MTPGGGMLRRTVRLLVGNLKHNLKRRARSDSSGIARERNKCAVACGQSEAQKSLPNSTQADCALHALANQ
jgi:hypothetical protein